jgi:DNA-binding LytR/AlgR family response regulator
MVKILIIEDDPLQAQEMAVFARNAGCKVAAVAGTGQQAIGLADTHRPDLLLCDVVLPGDLDGIQTAAIIRQTRNIPVVFLTNDREPLTKQRIKHSGETYLPKPYTESQLADAIEFALIDGENDKLTPYKVLEMNGYYFFHEYNGSRYHKVALSQILFIKSEEKKKIFHLKDSPNFTTQIGMSELIGAFRKPEIIQVHRSYLVNVLNVESINQQYLYFPGDRKAPVGEAYLPDLERVFTLVKGRR